MSDTSQFNQAQSFYNKEAPAKSNYLSGHRSSASQRQASLIPLTRSAMDFIPPNPFGNKLTNLAGALYKFGHNGTVLAFKSILENFLAIWPYGESI